MQFNDAIIYFSYFNGYDEFDVLIFYPQGAI